jgi:hypothetical protein
LEENGGGDGSREQDIFATVRGRAILDEPAVLSSSFLPALPHELPQPHTGNSKHPTVPGGIVPLVLAPHAPPPSAHTGRERGDSSLQLTRGKYPTAVDGGDGDRRERRRVGAGEQKGSFIAFNEQK